MIDIDIEFEELKARNITFLAIPDNISEPTDMQVNGRSYISCIEVENMRNAIAWIKRDEKCNLGKHYLIILHHEFEWEEYRLTVFESPYSDDNPLGNMPK